MIDWKRVVTTVVEDLQKQHSSRRLHLEPAESIAIAPYRGFGTPEEIVIRGRVIVEKLISRAAEAEPVWKNLVNAYRRFDSDEVPGAPVRATFGTASVEGTSDQEGYFALSLRPNVPPDPLNLWHEVSIELIERRDRFRPLRVSTQVLVPAAGAGFGVISDIDDTIVHTGAADLANMVRTVLLRNAPMRLPFEGVASLYQALQKGIGEAANPIFYISSSPWNLYELLEDFMTIQEIPLGPMLLQDFGIDPGKLIHLDHQPHKLEQIELLLRTYPGLSFVLMGDSGQKDPEIYLEVARKFASRLRAIFIRDVTLDPRDKAVEKIAAEASALEVPLFYVRDSAEAAVHAVRLGLIAR